MAWFPAIADEIDRLFDELVHQRWGFPQRFPPATVRTVGDGWELEVPVPNLTAADLEIEVRGRELTVRGRRQEQHEQQRVSLPGAARWSRSARKLVLVRSFLLPQPTSPDAVEARLEGETLRIHIRRS